MSVSDALTYERMQLAAYRRDAASRKLSRVERDLYIKKIEWVRYLKELEADGFTEVNADGTAGGPARPEDVSDHVALDVAEQNYNPYGDFN